jgi:transcription initiation factor TFIID subunit 3
MSRNYTRDHLKISVVKILQTLGWNSINSTPLEILTDILGSYISQITRNTNNYANEFGCTQPNLDYLGLTFRDMGICVQELEEYVKYVNFGPVPSPVPKYPIPKEDHLNFLKPGSKEVVTRPVHIHEHLPPMNPLLEGNKNEIETINCKVEEPEELNTENPQVFKKPADISPSEFKRPSFRREEEGSRPTREISSVMMTTSGFLSPAREGKLPESRTPISSVDPMGPTNTTSETIDLNKKPTKVVKKVEKKKIKADGTAHPTLLEEDKKKRMNSIKWVLKSKQQQQQKTPNKILNSIPHNNDVNISPVQNKMNSAAKVNKALAKLNTTITPITVKPASPQVFSNELDNVDKLFTEPDKKKVNIFKKISNVKNEKNEVKTSKKDDLKQESRESSPDLIIDEPDDAVPKFTHLSSDVTIEPINSTVPSKSPDKLEAPYFDDDSQPGTPLTPKTPEMISHSPPIVKEKRKRKDSKKVKRIQKNQSPHRLDNDTMDIDMERPKTPEAQGLTPKIEPPLVPVPLPNHAPPLTPIAFPFNFGGPGLIPTPLTNSLLPFPSMNVYNFGQKPHLPTFHQKLSEVPPPADVHTVEDFPPIKVNQEKPPPSDVEPAVSPLSKLEKKNKEHKKEKKDKIKKRNKKDKIKNKAEKKKLKEEKKEKIKKEKKEKRNKEKELKDGDSPGVKITLKFKSPSPRPETPETRKLNIKPIVKKEDEELVTSSEDRVKRETSPGLAKISALVCGPPKPKPANPPRTVPPAFNDSFPSSSSDNFVSQTKKTMLKPIPKIRTKEIRRELAEVPIIPPAPPSRYIDADGNEVWICPACGRQDDGSPMIGCDGCDAWYHW